MLGGTITLKSRTTLASRSELFCSSTSNAVTSWVDSYPSLSSAPSAFYFVNASTQESLKSDVAPFSFSPNEIVRISQSLTVAAFAAGSNLTLSAGVSFAVQCEATVPSTGTVVGCALNNRFVRNVDIAVFQENVIAHPNVCSLQVCVSAADIPSRRPSARRRDTPRSHLRPSISPL